MAATPAPARKRLGDLLKEKELVTEAEITKLLDESPNREGRLLGDLLLESSLVPKEVLVPALEEITGCSYVDARLAPLDPAVLGSIPHATAFRYAALPLQKEGRRLVVVMAEPQNLRCLDELRMVSRLEITPRLGLRPEIAAAVEKYYGRRQRDAGLAAAAAGAGAVQLNFVDAALADSLQFFRVSSSERSTAAIEEFAADIRNERTPAVRLASGILAAAVSKNASDLHIEPHAAGTVVRIRVDGVLRELTRVPHEFTHALISRIKILADMDIAERRVPQDGRLLIQCGGRSLDLRVSTLPVHEGEKVVMRLLDPAASRVCFTDLGFSPEHAKALNNILGMPQGMVLVTGPTEIDPPSGIATEQVRTAEEMAHAVFRHLCEASVILMAAAVADFRPVKVHSGKIKKQSGIPEVELEATTDIVAEIGRRRSADHLVVGFAAETDQLLDNAAAKLREKRLDLVVANDVSQPGAGFDVDTNIVTLLFPDGRKKVLEKMSKLEVANRVLDEVVEMRNTSGRRPQ